MISNEWTAAIIRELDESEAGAPAFNVPPALTYSAGTFFMHQVGAFRILFGMLEASIFADNAALVASKIMGEDIELPANFDPRVPLSREDGRYQRHARSVMPYLIEMIWIRIADNFNTYLIDVVGECLKTQTGLLKSSKDQISTEMILSFLTLEELQASLIERKLISIAYLSLEKQLDWISESLGVSDLKQRAYFPTLVELIEARNCMVHNRARIGAKYQKALTAFGVSVSAGHLLTPSIDGLFVAARATTELVTSLDQMLVAKFGLDAKPAPASPMRAPA